MKRKLLAVMMAVCMTASFAGGTATVFASSEASDTKTEVIIGFSGDGDSFDPCTGFGYTGSPLYSNLVKVNGDDQLENDLATEYTVSEILLKLRMWRLHLIRQKKKLLIWI